MKREASASRKTHWSRRRLLLKALRWCNPIVWWLALRRSMTGGSVTLLLMGIVSLNIVWGYPWMGTFAACFAMFVVGWVINRIMSPRLKVTLDVPLAVRAGESFVARVSLIHQGRLPAMSLCVGLDPSRRKNGRRDIEMPLDASAMQWIPEIASGATATLEQSLTFLRRGVHEMPPARVESLFPFHLFRSTQWIDSGESMVITPRRLDWDSETAWQVIHTSLRGLAVGLSQGDHQHYVGSREYRAGMPVRRWDFASWARLGKPILREFNSAAKQTVTVFIDTTPVESEASVVSVSRWRRYTDDEDASLERLLSIASAGLETLVGANVQVRLIVPWRAPSVIQSQERNGDLRSVLCEGASDPMPLLMALAEAEPVDASTAQDVLHAMPQAGGTFHGVVFSRRDRDAADLSHLPDLMWLDINEEPRDVFGGMAVSSNEKKSAEVLS
ncbi:DUF58 domain-containing protein [Rhodopirellula bahusiensis]|uniref:DUF58 domain-containing protein n=1 Tax=Rhodopirellula bahusiensis TaxID=2014065 RepID=A0A2G1W3L0_9BACT|nr:DUF58 domain-containing protein [Rhodopirellula bahusiensis]PHQ33571.1 DUF58 domain-containing protein [Rhodopirellula bahusiensis]